MYLQPFAEALSPTIHWQTAFGHAESVAALGIYVQFGATPGCFPFQIKLGAADGGDRIVTGDGNEQGRRVRRYGLSVRGAAVNRRGEVGAARRVIFHDYAHGEHAACREAHQAYAIGGDAPFHRPLANNSDSLRAVGDSYNYAKVTTVLLDDQTRFRQEKLMQWTDTAVEVGQSYRYRVIAFTTDGYRSVPSAPVTIVHKKVAAASPDESK